MIRSFSLVAALTGALALGVSLNGTSSASYASATAAPLGMVPVLGAASSRPMLGSGNLRYHGGPVMHTNKTYAIYWTPPNYNYMESGYQSLINGFFSNVAADSGKTSNVYYSDTQYYDGGGNVKYSSAFGGSTVDTDALPSSGCHDSDTPVCLSDSQIQAEIAKVVAAQGWSTGQSSEVFLFTAKSIGSCLSGSSCAFTQYCAYHGSFTSKSGLILYANMPYADTVPSACDAGNHPNGNDADATLNVTSHEHNETITDQQGNAWFDAAGYENGDKCAWNFGAQLGGGSGTHYNQVIHGAHYELQQEWSNHSSRCVLTNT